MFLGLALILGALLWARDIRRKSPAKAPSFRGPWVMGTVGACVFLFYLWLITHEVFTV
jgi:hypothetical protein